MAKPSDPFYYEMRNDPIVGKIDGSSLAVWRTTTRVYRTADGKLLGEEVAYSRRGGDPWGPWHSSSFACSPTGGVLKAVFSKAG
jgi:hypothetical protein